MNSSRTVRIFISSTFRDFAGERDELVKKVFPELRRRCKARFVELLEVDLRWGVTEEQSRRGETLRICLQEIDRCRPSTPVFFIGLLGERYGWIPEAGHYPKDMLADPDLQWVREHAGGKSVTELEILHGVLNNPAMAARAYFYFRKEGYQHRHWPEIQAMYPFLKPADFGNASESHAVKQRALKERVRQSGLWHEPQDYETPAEMAQRALADMWSEIDRAFPADEAPDEHERQWMEHEAFAQSRTKGYVPRAGLFDELRWRSPICRVITGQSGGGKSALVAAWMAQAKLPERTFVHYIGGTPESSTVQNIVLRLMETIRRWGAVREPIPNDFGEAVQVLPQWLAQAAEKQKGGVLLVLDALNQMGEERDQQLWWLPKELPKGVRLVVSTLPGPSEEALKARGWLTEQTVIEVPPLTDPERREIIASYLGRCTKKLEPRIVERLATAPQTSNALFLKVALDELRLRGRHEELGAMVEQMLEAKDPIALFVQVLKGLEEFDRDRPNLVREAMGYLHAARRGLTESELLQLLSEHPEPASQPLPMAVWSPLYQALEESLVSRFGRLGFFHCYLRQAVEQEYLDEEWERRKVHGRLGEVALAWDTEKFSPTLRAYGLAYGAHHLRQEGDPEKLWTLLQDEGCRKAQQQEFKRVDESVEGLRHGVDVYAQQDGQTDEDDVRLCWLMLRCGEVVQEARTSLQPVFEEFRTRPLDDPNRVEGAMSRLQILDEARFYQACQLLLYIECECSETEGKPVSIPRVTKIVEAVEAKVPKGTGVLVCGWIEEKLALNLPLELLERLVQRTKISVERWTEGADQSRRNTSQSLASAKRWDEALEVAGMMEGGENKAEALASIAAALAQAGKFPRALKLAEKIDKQGGRSSAFRSIIHALAKAGYCARALKLMAKLDSVELQVSTISTIATCLAISGHPSRAEKLFSLALKTASKIVEDDKDRAFSLIVKSFAHVGMFDRAFDVTARIEDPRERFEALVAIATRLTIAGSNRKSAEVFELALQLAETGLGIESLDDHRNAFNEVFIEFLEAGNTNLALLAAQYGLLQPVTIAQGFAQVEKFDLAAQFIDDALAEAAKIAGQIRRSECLQEIADTLAKIGKLEGSMCVADQVQTGEMKSVCFHTISATLALTGNAEGAKRFFCSSIEAVGRRETSGQSAANSLSIGMAFAQAGDYRRAFRTIHLFKTSWQQTKIAVAIVDHLAQTDDRGQVGELFKRVFEIIGKVAFADEQSKVVHAIVKACAKLGYFQGRDEFLTAVLKVNPEAGASAKESVLQVPHQPKKSSTATAMTEAEMVHSIEASIKKAGDQAWAFKSIASDLAAHVSVAERWVQIIGPITRPEKFYDFLVNLETSHSNHQRNLAWLRLFTRLCPKRLDIGQKLAADLVVAHIQAGNLPHAQKIAQRCPQLGLSEMLN